jgi:hypothetical protein
MWVCFENKKELYGYEANYKLCSCAIHGIQTRSIQNDTLENRIVALEKLVENLEDRIKNGTNRSKHNPIFKCIILNTSGLNSMNCTMYGNRINK